LLAARKEPDVEIEVELTEEGTARQWRYAIGITQQVRGYASPFFVSRGYGATDLILERPDGDDKLDYLRRTQTHLEQINSNAEFREIARFFESIRYLHLVPQLLRNPEAFQGPSIPDDPYGRNFLEMVAKRPRRRASPG